nr:unnamed protein product [Callosobruchus chinensis]
MQDKTLTAMNFHYQKKFIGFYYFRLPYIARIQHYWSTEEDKELIFWLYFIHLSIDEQMVHYLAASKPVRFRFKLWCLVHLMDTSFIQLHMVLLKSNSF